MDVTAGYEADAQQKKEIAAWFTEYDTLVAEGDVEAMADRALFPLNEVTDDEHGHGLVSATGRDRFVAQMREEGVGAGEVEMRSVRTPFFLSPALVFVVTDAVFGSGDEATTMRYGDLLVRTAEGWRFQTMVAGGWAGEI
ncbi:hypothetical protein ACWFNE_01780 [Cellulomonas sp. NPDC055163]